MRARHPCPLPLLFPHGSTFTHLCLKKKESSTWKMCLDSYVICIIWSSHHWCFFFMKREFKDNSEEEVVYTKPYKALWKTVLGWKTDLTSVPADWRLKPAASAGPSPPDVPWVVSGHMLLAAPALCPVPGCWRKGQRNGGFKGWGQSGRLGDAV